MPLSSPAAAHPPTARVPGPSDHYWRGLVRRLHSDGGGGSSSGGTGLGLYHRPFLLVALPSSWTLLQWAVDAALCGVFLMGAWGVAALIEGLANANDLACRDVGRCVSFDPNS